MPLVEQLFQPSDPARQPRTALLREYPARRPELLLRVPDVQGQGRAAEQPPQSLLQARLAVNNDLDHLGGSGGKPRRVACVRAHSSADVREPNVPNTFLWTGPCSRPSSPRRSVYITTSVALRPFLLLSPLLPPRL